MRSDYLPALLPPVTALLLSVPFSRGDAFLTETFTGRTSPIANQTSSDGNGSWSETRSGGVGEGIIEASAQPFVISDNPFGSSTAPAIRHSPGLDSTLTFPPLAAGQSLYFSFNYKSLDGDAVSHAITFFTEHASLTPFMNLSFTQNATDGTQKDLTLKAQNETQTLVGAIQEDTSYFVSGKLVASSDLKTWTFSVNLTADPTTIPTTETWTLSRSKTYPQARSSHANRLSFDTGGSGTGRYLIDDIRLGTSYADVVNLQPEDRTGQIIVFKMDDLRAHVPATGVQPVWIDLMTRIRAAGAVATIGIPSTFIEQASTNFAGGGQEWIDWVKAQQAAGDVEFWQHGWDHLQALDEDPSGNTAEFEATLARQRQHFTWAQEKAPEVLGFEFRTFGAPGNKVNADTMTVLDEHPEILARFYGDDRSLLSKAFNIRRIGGSLESPIYFMNRTTYDNIMQSHADRSYLCFQMHPEYWDANQMAIFQDILQDLAARNVTFMTAQQLVAHVEARRKAMGSIIDFNQRGDFDFLFHEAGQVNKYSSVPVAGLAGSRGLAVGSGGGQSALVLQRTLPGNTPRVELSIHFQYSLPTSSGGQPLFLGLGPNDRYNPNLGSGTAEQDHLLVALDFNGTPTPSQPRLRISTSANGTLSQSTGAYIHNHLVPGNWYRLRAVIHHDLEGYDIEATLEDSTDQGVIGQTLGTHHALDRMIPDLAQTQAYPFLGGQGNADARGISKLDQLFVSALKPHGQEDGLLAWEGVRNPAYRQNHTAYSGTAPEVRGFSSNAWSSGYTASTRPAGWNGSTNADAASQGLQYTGSGGESLLTAFSYRKLETARSVRELELTAFPDHVHNSQLGKEGTTLYLSFLLQPRLQDADGQVSFELLSNGSTSSNRVFGIGIDRSQDDQLRAAGNGAYATPYTSLGVATALQTEFVVAKIEFGAGDTPGNERITLWRNPAWLRAEFLSEPSAILTDVPHFQFDRMER